MNSKLNVVVIAAMTMAMTLSACESNGPTTTGVNTLSDQRGALLTDAATADQLAARIQWQQNLNLPADGVQSVTPLGNRLAVVEKGNILDVLNTDNGQVLWRQSIGDRTSRLGVPTRVGKRLMIATETDFYIYNIDVGSLDQRFPLAHNASTRPLVDESQVIFGSPSGRVFSQFLQSGVLRWEFNMGSAIVGTPVALTGMVVVVDQTGSVAMLNSNNGHVIWRDVRPPWAPVVAQPVVANAITYVASTDQKLYALDRISGHAIWQYLTEKPLTADPVAIGDRIYQRTADQGLLCLDGLSGEVYWKSAAPGRPVLLHANKLWLRDPTGVTFADPATGLSVKTVALPASVHLIMPNIDAKDFYLVGGDGRVMKLGLK
ncbi:MAG: PQQ-binding-like beta-propeller repeat protein [Phycisphaeraceae bacterium]